MKYGVGVSLGVYGCGLDGVDSSQADAELMPDGTVTIYTAWEDHGQGADMGALVSSHETLRQAGFKPEDIRLVMCDTKLTPNAGPAGGSRSQVMSGNACRLACENLLAAMKKPDGTYRTYAEMKADGIETRVKGQWVATYCADHPVDQATAQGEPFSVYMYSIFMPEVAVNTETGKVKVEKFTCVADVGTIMNRLLVEGNFYGGLVQGIGLALSARTSRTSSTTPASWPAAFRTQTTLPTISSSTSTRPIVPRAPMARPAAARLLWMLLTRRYSTPSSTPPAHALPASLQSRTLSLRR
jgi:aldehyde oxidoreductase